MTVDFCIDPAQPAEAAVVASVLQEAAQWLTAGGRPLWSAPDISVERISSDVQAGDFFIARADGEVAGVMKFQLEDPHFWPEIEPGSSAFVHKLAVRRAWAGAGVSSALLAFAHQRASGLGRQHLRLDCVADRAGLRTLYERFGFRLHSTVSKGAKQFARYELPAAAPSAT